MRFYKLEIFTKNNMLLYHIGKILFCLLQLYRFWRIPFCKRCKFRFQDFQKLSVQMSFEFKEIPNLSIWKLVSVFFCGKLLLFKTNRGPARVLLPNTRNAETKEIFYQTHCAKRKITTVNYTLYARNTFKQYCAAEEIGSESFCPRTRPMIGKVKNLYPRIYLLAEPPTMFYFFLKKKKKSHLNIISNR